MSDLSIIRWFAAIQKSAYAGFPLNNDQAHRIGTPVIDRKPNHLSEDQLQIMEALARQVVVFRSAQAVDQIAGILLLSR